MMWLQRAMGNRTPAISPIENNPVGWSSTYAPEVLTNPSPTVSPLASAMLNSSDQKIGRFWNAATGRAKQHYTGADMPQLTAAGNEGIDSALGWAGMTTPMAKQFPVNLVVDPKRAGSVDVLPGGNVTYYVPWESPWGITQDVRDTIRRAVESRVQPPPGNEFYRLTNNADEVALARSGQLRPSRNYVENISEPGVSVADGPHYAGQGYKYGYRVAGDVVGKGSDGEPVLNPKTLRALSDLMPVDDLIKLHSQISRPALENALRQIGWTPEHLEAFQKGFLTRADSK